jgi:uncharacterized membrane protein
VRARLVLLGCLLFLASCSLPYVGLWSGAGKADTGLYGQYGAQIADGHVPYRDFYIEFPPGALPALALPALPGSHYVAWFKALMLACGLGCVVVVAVVRPDPRAVLAVGVAPALLGPITLNSFDLWPALLTVAAVALVLAGRETSGAAMLGLSAAAKLFGVLVLPVFLVHAWRHGGRRAAARSLAAFCAAVIVVWGPFAALAPGGLGYSLRTQLTRGLQIESLWASILTVAHRLGLYTAHVTIGKPFSVDLGGSLPRVLTVLSSLLVLGAAAAVWRLYAAGPPSPQRFTAAVAAAVVAFLAFGRVLSPQYMLWLVPLVPLAGGAATGLFLGALALTLVWARFPEPFGSMTRLGPEVWAVLARNLVLVAIYAVLAARLSRTSTTP